ncbi:hypothetical protein NPIL_49301 [Nephila pilipes]|uniref:Uncharacterized protein n=1 Tax=Nephila pilipes TaxID=299642 RepID=A0A8X6M866_NEPPI|nr:hypothetical protein NPIL_49301 [Nephila pilipes]
MLHSQVQQILAISNDSLEELTEMVDGIMAAANNDRNIENSTNCIARHVKTYVIRTIMDPLGIINASVTKQTSALNHLVSKTQDFPAHRATAPHLSISHLL